MTTLPPSPVLTASALITASLANKRFWHLHRYRLTLVIAAQQYRAATGLPADINPRIAQQSQPGRPVYALRPPLPSATGAGLATGVEYGIAAGPENDFFRFRRPLHYLHSRPHAVDQRAINTPHCPLAQ